MRLEVVGFGSSWVWSVEVCRVRVRLEFFLGGNGE